MIFNQPCDAIDDALATAKLINARYLNAFIVTVNGNIKALTEVQLALPAYAGADLLEIARWKYGYD
tara:strand:- start:257 stop:454 length:198 start_codon:yes stop_codon:yes gene_type:complete